MLRRNKKKLKALADKYKLKKEEFINRHEKLVEEFNLTEEEHKKVAFGIVIPSPLPLKPYTDILNCDPELNNLSDEFRELFLNGCMIIIKKVKVKGITIPGYNLETYFDNPKENFHEIESLILGLHGYEHIHIIDEKILLEIPARIYIKEHPDLLKCVDYWVKNLEIFEYN